MKFVIISIIFFSSLHLIAQEIPISNPMFLWYNRPAVIESKFNYKGKILLGYVDTDKRVQVAILKNGLLDTTICLYEYNRLTSDDHGSPAIIEFKNRIVAFHSYHTSELYQTTYDITSKKVSTTIIDSLATYNQVFQFKNGRIVLLYNKSVVDSNGQYSKRRISLRYSDNAAQTWSDEIVVLDPNDNECPYFVANVAGNKIAIAYALYNQNAEIMQHRNLYMLNSDKNLSKWYNNYEYTKLPIKESKPVYTSPDSLDINVFDVNIKRKPEILFTMFEPYYSENRFQNAKLYLYTKGKVRYVGENSTTVYSTGGVFSKNKIYNIKERTIEEFTSLRNLRKNKSLQIDSGWRLREIRVAKKGVYIITSDSTYIKEGYKWNTKMLFLENKK